ncbi:MAG: 16S rRNA processing protein RimM [Rhizobiales bacterium]|nr:16S rRNA processing protein RimM [Hyphomicrobiales bacterium]
MMLILLGIITGAHGIRGEVKLRSFTADPQAIAQYGPLQTKSGDTIEIIRLKPQKDHFIAALKGVTGRNRAEALRGTELFVAREKLPPTDETEIYVSDLIGRPVVSNGTVIGEVVGIENYGAGDLLDVKLPGRRGTVLIPLGGDFISSIANGTITVDLPEGYLDEK